MQVVSNLFARVNRVKHGQSCNKRNSTIGSIEGKNPLQIRHNPAVSMALQGWKFGEGTLEFIK